MTHPPVLDDLKAIPNLGDLIPARSSFWSSSAYASSVSMRNPETSPMTASKDQAPVDYLPERSSFLFPGCCITTPAAGNTGTTGQPATPEALCVRENGHTQALLQADLVHRLPNSGVGICSHFAHSPLPWPIREPVKRLDSALPLCKRHLYLRSATDSGKIAQARLSSPVPNTITFSEEIPKGRTSIHRCTMDRHRYFSRISQAHIMKRSDASYRILTVARMTAKRIAHGVSALKSCATRDSFQHTYREERIGTDSLPHQRAGLFHSLDCLGHNPRRGTGPLRGADVSSWVRSAPMETGMNSQRPSGSMAAGSRCGNTYLRHPGAGVEGETACVRRISREDGRALIRLLTDIPLRQQVIQEARKRVARLFDSGTDRRSCGVYRKEVRELGHP